MACEMKAMAKGYDQQTEAAIVDLKDANTKSLAK